MFTQEQLSGKINACLDSLGYCRRPEDLYHPIQYALSLGGKRLRPILTMMACDAFCGDPDKALQVAAGIEIYHNHTLLHDDVMDKADIRRGKPTVHKKWNDNVAILSGDAMLILAYKVLSSCGSDKFPEILHVFTETTLQICEGQQFDMEFETRDDVTVEEYMEMIRLKTAVLLACALKCGAIAGGASNDDAEALYNFGIEIGLAFQLQDDVLDVYGDPAVFGKKIGGDIMCDKKTFLLISAEKMAGAEDKAVLDSWIGHSECDPESKIAAVTGVYDRTGVREMAEHEIDAHFEKAMQYLDLVSLKEERKSQLRAVAAHLMHRSL